MFMFATEISRQLGFLRFRTLDDSREFLERNFPAIYLYGKNPSDADDNGVKVRIAYSREREDRNRVRAEGEWTCTIVGRKALIWDVLLGLGLTFKVHHCQLSWAPEVLSMSGSTDW